MPNDDHKALGPALGCVYQFERATYRLLEADSVVVSVAIEHVDDVSVHRADGTTIREQDKLSTSKKHRVHSGAGIEKKFFAIFWPLRTLSCKIRSYTWPVSSFLEEVRASTFHTK